MAFSACIPIFELPSFLCEPMYSFLSLHINQLLGLLKKHPFILCVCPCVHGESYLSKFFNISLDNSPSMFILPWSFVSVSLDFDVYSFYRQFPCAYHLIITRLYKGRYLSKDRVRRGSGGWDWNWIVHIFDFSLLLLVLSRWRHHFQILWIAKPLR